MMQTRIQDVIQIDLLAGASLDMPRDEQFEFIDYLLAAHCGFAEFYLPNEMAPYYLPGEPEPWITAMFDGTEKTCL